MLRKNLLQRTTSARAWNNTQWIPRCLWTLWQRLLKHCKLLQTQAWKTSTCFTRSSNRHLINRREIPLHQMRGTIRAPRCQPRFLSSTYLSKSQYVNHSAKSKINNRVWQNLDRMCFHIISTTAYPLFVRNIPYMHLNPCKYFQAWSSFDGNGEYLS